MVRYLDCLNIYSYQAQSSPITHHSMMLNTPLYVDLPCCLLKLKLQVRLESGFQIIYDDFIGPAPKADFETEDIVDEAIQQFRANILFKSYDIRGNADKVLVYLTVFIQKCLEVIAKKYFCFNVLIIFLQH